MGDSKEIISKRDIRKKMEIAVKSVFKSPMGIVGAILTMFFSDFLFNTLVEKISMKITLDKYIDFFFNHPIGELITLIIGLTLLYMAIKDGFRDAQTREQEIEKDRKDAEEKTNKIVDDRLSKYDGKLDALFMHLAGNEQLERLKSESNKLNEIKSLISGHQNKWSATPAESLNTDSMSLKHEIAQSLGLIRQKFSLVGSLSNVEVKITDSELADRMSIIDNALKKNNEETTSLHEALRRKNYLSSKKES